MEVAWIVLSIWWGMLIGYLLTKAVRALKNRRRNKEEKRRAEIRQFIQEQIRDARWDNSERYINLKIAQNLDHESIENIWTHIRQLNIFMSGVQANRENELANE